jgi:hypothetical protein
LTQWIEVGHLNQREEVVREGSFRWDDFYIHQSQNASIITAKDRKTLSPAASRLHWMQMISDKPILPVVTASVSTTTNAQAGFFFVWWLRCQLALLVTLQLSHLASKVADASGDSGVG